MEPARLDFERSLALHRAVAQRLPNEPALIDRARQKLDEWIARNDRSAPLLRRWRGILERSPEQVAEFLTERSEEAAWLRSASPFAGVLDLGRAGQSCARSGEKWRCHAARRQKAVDQGSRSLPPLPIIQLMQWRLL